MQSLRYLLTVLPSSYEQENLPYWLHVVVAIGVFALGGAIWFVYAHVLPRRGGYRLESVEVLGEDGVKRDVITKKYD